MDRRQLVYLGATAVASLCAGFGVGYYATKKKLEVEFDERMEYEIDQIRNFYARVAKKDEFETPEKAAEALLPEEVTAKVTLETKDATEEDKDENPPKENAGGLDGVLEGLQYKPREPVDYTKISTAGKYPKTKTKKAAPSQKKPTVQSEEPEGVVENVFQKSKVVKPMDHNDEASEVPYVISEEAAMLGKEGYVTDTLTYFAGDYILADSRDETVEDVDIKVGLNNLKPLEKGEATSVYVRNDKLMIDFEILRSSGKYSVEVLGLTSDSVGDRG